MSKLKTIIRYECVTSFKYIWIFYGIQYAIVLLLTLIIGFAIGADPGGIRMSSLEMNTLIYVGILGLLGFHEDFKMLIQNGFTRRYIFIATITMFCFISGIMAFVDTLVGNILAGRVLSRFNNGYSSLYGSIYGNDNIFMNWLWLFLLYVAVCCLLYLAVLVINQAGKVGSICIGAALCGVVILILALFSYVFTQETEERILEFLMKAMGFMPDGTVNYLCPVLTLLILIAGFGLGAYAVVRRIQLK